MLLVSVPACQQEGKAVDIAQGLCQELFALHRRPHCGSPASASWSHRPVTALGWRRPCPAHLRLHTAADFGLGLSCYLGCFHISQEACNFFLLGSAGRLASDTLLGWSWSHARSLDMQGLATLVGSRVFQAADTRSRVEATVTGTLTWPWGDSFPCSAGTLADHQWNQTPVSSRAIKTKLSPGCIPGVLEGHVGSL